MTEPLSIETILAEFSDEDETWVLQDQLSSQYVTIPDERYPGRRPIRFFLSRHDADSVLQELRAVNPLLREARITPTKVRTKRAIASIAMDKTPGHADAFVVYSPNEVFEFVLERRGA
jgi:hypothetical protein